MESTKKQGNASRISEENFRNPIWSQAWKERSVARTYRYSTLFSDKTWEDFERTKDGKQVVIIGNRSRYADWSDRYQDETILMDPTKENYDSMQSCLKSLSPGNFVVVIIYEAWEQYAACLEIFLGTLEQVFVYKFLNHNRNVEEQSLKTWDTLCEDARNGKLFLVTPNIRAKEFVRFFSDEIPVAGFLSGKKGDIGTVWKNYVVQSDNEFHGDTESVFLLCSVNWNDYINRLKGRGYEYVYALRLLCRMNPNHPWSKRWQSVLAVTGVGSFPESAYRRKIDIVLSLLADEDSKITLRHILSLRNSARDDWQFVAVEDPKRDPDYFVQHFLTFGLEETYLDVGPQFGDTISDFIERVGNRYRKIYALEIGRDCLDTLYSAFTDSRIVILPYGAWHKTDKMSVVGIGGARQVSKTASTSETVVCRKIDDVVEGPVTMIKMDIEGAEINALRGAENTIRKYKPKLAISIYHKFGDMWDIPLLIHEMVPEYQLYIRHHRKSCCDTVLYATLPPPPPRTRVRFLFQWKLLRRFRQGLNRLFKTY